MVCELGIRPIFAFPPRYFTYELAFPDKHSLPRAELVIGRRILELGCGIGFLGIIAGSIQASASSPNTSSLWLTDVNERVLRRCEHNLRLPCSACRPQARRYHAHYATDQSRNHPDLNVQLVDWSDALDPSRLSRLRAFFRNAQPDIILGADLVESPVYVCVDVTHPNPIGLRPIYYPAASQGSLGGYGDRRPWSWTGGLHRISVSQ